MAILPNLVAFQFSRIRRPPYIFPTVSRPFPISENQELEMHQMPRDAAEHAARGTMDIGPISVFLFRMSQTYQQQCTCTAALPAVFVIELDIWGKNKHK